MNRKINLFTMMIFVYSIIICATFKKDNNLSSIETSKIESKKTDLKKSNTIDLEKITASNSNIKNPNQ